MNIEAKNKIETTKPIKSTQNKAPQENGVKFAQELEQLSKTTKDNSKNQSIEKEKNITQSSDKKNTEDAVVDNKKTIEKTSNEEVTDKNIKKDETDKITAENLLSEDVKNVQESLKQQNKLNNENNSEQNSITKEIQPKLDFNTKNKEIIQPEEVLDNNIPVENDLKLDSISKTKPFEENISKNKKETEITLKIETDLKTETKSDAKPLEEKNPFIEKELQVKKDVTPQVKNELKPQEDISLEPEKKLEIRKQDNTNIEIKPAQKTDTETSIKPELETLVQPDNKVEPHAKPLTETKIEIKQEENLANLNNKFENKIETDYKPETNIKLDDEIKPDKIENLQTKNEKINDVLDGLKNIVNEIKQTKKENKKEETIDRIDEKKVEKFKNNPFIDDKKDKELNEDENLINNDMNIQEPQDKFTPQMNAGMNFNSDGKPFSEFVNTQPQKQELKSSEKDLAEEAAILSSMAENIAIANKNIVINQTQPEKIQKPQPNKAIQEKPILTTTNIEPQKEIAEPEVKTVINEQGVKKVDTKSNITVETVVKYDSVIMNEADVEFFTKLVENGSVEMNTATQANAKSSQVSKTLADLIAKSMNDKQPIRIDFDNDISVIIKISKDGKISADFLPSSQIAEAYLKENLPILRQKFEDNNIEYDELNQRKQKQDDKDNRKKGRKDE